MSDNDIVMMTDNDIVMLLCKRAQVERAVGNTHVAEILEKSVAEINRLEDELLKIYRTTRDLDTARRATAAVWPKKDKSDE